MRIRNIDPTSEEEIVVVAARMRATLEEVLGEERGRGLYAMEWLRERVRFHLDPTRCTGAVFVAEDDGAGIVGHTIVRVEREEDGAAFGLFSTTYVVPSHRRAGVARELLRRGEAWMRAQGMTRAATNTSEANVKLIRLYEEHGYVVVLRAGEMLRLGRTLS